MLLYENNISLASGSGSVGARILTQENLLLTLEETVLGVSRQIKDFIINSPRSLLYWSPGELRPGIALLAEQLINNRQYFFQFAHKFLQQHELNSYSCTKNFRSGAWGNYVYNQIAKKSLDSDDMALRELQPGKFLFAQALLPYLYETQGKWDHCFSQFRFLDVSSIFIRVPMVSIFPLRLGDMLRIIVLTEQKIITRIRDIETIKMHTDSIRYMNQLI